MLGLNIPENKSEPITLIVKYRGDFGDIPRGIYLSGDDLGSGFALITLYAGNAAALLESPAVIYAEADKTLTFSRTEYTSPRSLFCAADTELDGTGTVIGIIDSPVDIRHPAFADTDIEYYGPAPTAADRHGTNVAGIAAAAAPGAKLICMGISGDGTDFAKASEIMLAASQLVGLAEGRPLAINISYGTNNGSHTGGSLFEEYLNTLAQNELTAIVAAAGNFGSLARHFYGVSNGGAVSAELSVARPDFGIGIWRNFADEFAVQLTAPNSETFTLPAESTSVYFHGSIGIFVGTPAPYTAESEIYIGFEEAERGIWKITLIPRLLATEGAVNMWLSENVFTAPAPYTTATIPGYAQRLITAAAYDPRSSAPAPFSGRGPAANGLQKPDIAAPGVGIYTADAGGGFTTVSGTSFAAPFVSAAAAMLMQWGIVLGRDPFLYGQRLKAYLQRGARRFPGIIYPDAALGYGLLCFENTLAILEREVGR